MAAANARILRYVLFAVFVSLPACLPACLTAAHHRTTARCHPSSPLTAIPSPPVHHRLLLRLQLLIQTSPPSEHRNVLAWLTNPEAAAVADFTLLELRKQLKKKVPNLHATIHIYPSQPCLKPSPSSKRYVQTPVSHYYHIVNLSLRSSPSESQSPQLTHRPILVSRQARRSPAQRLEKSAGNITRIRCTSPLQSSPYDAASGIH